MKKTVCAIIGSGVIAPVHIESYRKCPGVVVKYLCDLIPAKAAELATKYDIPHTCTDYRAVLADPEVNCVSVCTDHASHAEIAAAAFDAGKNVICEKCLAATPAQLDMMLSAHKRHPELIFSGVFQHRYEPNNIILRKMINEGKFGRMLSASLHVACLRTDEYYNADAWRGTWAQEGGSVLINQTVHHFDLLRFFLGEADELCAKYDNLVHQKSIETEDTITIAIRFKSGVLVSFVATSGCKAAPWRSGYSFAGTEGYLEYNEFVPGFLNFTSEELTKQITEEFANSAGDQALTVGKTYYGTAHPAQIANFIDAVRGENELFVTGEDAAGTARMVHAAYESGRTGKWVKL